MDKHTLLEMLLVDGRIRHSASLSPTPDDAIIASRLSPTTTPTAKSTLPPPTVPPKALTKTPPRGSSVTTPATTTTPTPTTTTAPTTPATTPARCRTSLRPTSRSSNGASSVRPRPRSRSCSRPRAAAEGRPDGGPQFIDKSRLLTLLAKADEIVSLDELEDEVHAKLMRWATAAPQRAPSLAAEDPDYPVAEATPPNRHARLRTSIVDCVVDHPRALPLVTGRSVAALLEVCKLIEQELGEDDE